MSNPCPTDTPRSPGASRRAELLGCAFGGSLMGVILTAGNAWSFRHKLDLLAERGTPAQEVPGVVLLELALPCLFFLLACLGPVLVWSTSLWRRPGWRESTWGRGSMWKSLLSYTAIILPFWLAPSILIKLLLWKVDGSIEGWLAEGIAGVFAVALGGLGGFLWGILFIKDDRGSVGELSKNAD